MNVVDGSLRRFLGMMQVRVMVQPRGSRGFEWSTPLECDDSVRRVGMADWPSGQQCNPSTRCSADGGRGMVVTNVGS